MSLLKGGCRLCHCDRQLQPRSAKSSTEGSLPHHRRRRRRPSTESSKRDQRSVESFPRNISPSLLLIQCRDDERTTSSPKTTSISLCKWSSKKDEPTPAKTSNEIPTNNEILVFDESIEILPLSSNYAPEVKVEELFLQSFPHDTTAMEESKYNESRKPIPEALEENGVTVWTLNEIDVKMLNTQCSCCNDQNPTLENIRHLEINRNQPLGSRLRHCDRVAIPLYPSMIDLEPLQSLVISIVGQSTVSPTDGEVLHTFFRQSDNPNRMAILMEAFWKRQLVGKILACNKGWTSRIRLDDDDNHRQPRSTVYAQVESVTPLPIAAPMSPSTTSERSSLFPTQFYMVLPSTYITIRRGPSTQQSKVESAQISTNSEKLRKEPPSQAARLLMETLDCIREGGSDTNSENSTDIPRTFLLSGAPGVGKTFSVSWAANAHPNTVQASIRGSELLQGKDSRSPMKAHLSSPSRALEWEFLKMVKTLSVRDQQAKKESELYAGLLFLDECDALVSVEPVAAMLAYLLDRISSTNETNDEMAVYWKRIVVVGATNRIDSIPSYLRRAGRFDRELPLSPPTARERSDLLISLLAKIPDTQEEGSSEGNSTTLDPGVAFNELEEIAELCVGYVAADLSALVRKAWILSLQDNERKSKGIDVSHLRMALHHVGASALRDASLASPPKITWDHIAGDPGGAKTALRQAIEWPRLKAREFQMLGLQPCRGMLLHGPPGCAKTTLARAAAGSSGVAFLSLSPAQVYASSYVGEAERIVRQAFHLARSTSPCILFFDEIDAIFGSSGGNGGASGNLGGSGRGSSAEARVLSTFLNEMDGVDIAGAGKDGVLVLGATNRPWTLDPALLRPGRLGDKIIYLPPPDDEARRSIFVKQFEDVSKKASGEEWKLDYSILVELSEGMTGAEIVGACQEAKIHWMKETIFSQNDVREVGCSTNKDDERFTSQDFVVHALTSIKPLLSNPEALEEFQVFEDRDRKGIHR